MCDVCERAQYCSLACLKKDKRFHTKTCIPVDKIEVVSGASNIVIEVQQRKREQKADEKAEVSN
jgi:hypothetical protein